MIEPAEVARFADQLGVDRSQVRRDHLVSHCLSVLGSLEEMCFFGGTALARTHLAGRRISEDIDLLADDHSAAADRLRDRLLSDLATEFPALTWAELSRRSRLMTVTVENPGIPSLKIQIVRTEPHEKRGEYELRDVELRYSDLPESVRMTVPTLPTFAAMKLSAWADRKTPRDLFDLAGLEEIGAIDAGAVEMHRRLFGHAPVVVEFGKLPATTANAWFPELGHQTTGLPDADECLARVRAAVEAARASAA